MNILLIGYGKMGKTIERIAIGRGHTIAGRIDEPSNQWQLPANVDVAIEFTHPDSAVGNLKKCLQSKVPVVCGTTGWLSHKPEVDQLCAQQGGAFFYASNYSLGVNIFFKVNEYLARLMNSQSDYQVSIDETHHTEKKDAPSGTAITLAEGILKHVERKVQWTKGESKQSTDLAIRSHRIDPAPGTHVITYQSPIDTIEITHTAHTREGFAKGAVLAAEWLVGKRGVFGMDDLLEF
ncbi:MAG: 4-hydroxy-tetrahydrodipicolinate reductase [Bacteroidota bacterium]